MLHVMVQSPEWLSRSDATDKAAILQILAVTFTGLKMLVVIGTSVCISSQPIDVLVLRMDPHSHPSRSPISCPCVCRHFPPVRSLPFLSHDANQMSIPRAKPG